MKYLRQFNNQAAYSAAKEGSEFFRPCVSLIKDDMHVEYDVPERYVTFTAQQDNSRIRLAELSTNQTLEYSTDASVWNTFDISTSIYLNNGDKVYIRGILSANNSESNYTQFKMSGKIAASGNCNALWNYEDLDAPLKNYCGYYMFYKCESLTTAPELPAKTLAKDCYECMFSGCKSLTTAPKLPATTLTNSCYLNMFSGCTSLTTAPELPVTTLAPYCYSNMFWGCTSLTVAPELPATTLAKSCYYGMFDNCTNLATAPTILPATTLFDSCYYYMFRDCTSLITSPELPALTLIRNCYHDMFYGCTKLNYIKCLATTNISPSSTGSWIYGVSSTGTFVKHPDATWTTVDTSGAPSSWTIEDAVL